MNVKYYFTPEILDALPEELAELYRQLEIQLLEQICSRIRVAGQMNEVTVQNIRALRSHGIDLEDIKKAIQQTTGSSQEKLEELFADVVERNKAYYGSMANLADITIPEHALDLEDTWAIYEQTRGTLKNITRSMGFVVENGRVMLPPAKAYQWALDQAVIQVESGAVSYNDAIRDAVKQLADSGLMTVTDPKTGSRDHIVEYESGHRDHVDVAVRRAVLTGVGQLNAQYAEQAMDFLETDLVEVSAHMGARNIGEGPQNHESWQGFLYRYKDHGR